MDDSKKDIAGYDTNKGTLLDQLISPVITIKLVFLKILKQIFVKASVNGVFAGSGYVGMVQQVFSQAGTLVRGDVTAALKYIRYIDGARFCGNCFSTV